VRERFCLLLSKSSKVNLGSIYLFQSSDDHDSSDSCRDAINDTGISCFESSFV
jgi:hypothetical protein